MADQNPIVDHMITEADFAVNFDTRGMKRNETRVMGLTREQLGNAIGVHADSSLFGIKKIQLHGTSAPLSHSFGFVIGHSDDVTDPQAVHTGQKAIFTDQTNASAHLFHALSTPGRQTMAPIHIHETAGALEAGPTQALRRAARWRINPGEEALLGPESVKHGVTKSSIDLGNGKKSVKYLVTPFSTDGEMKPSAMHRLLTQNCKNKAFFNGRYDQSQRKTVPHLGQSKY